MLVDLPINRIEVNKSKDKQNKRQTKTAGMTMKHFFNRGWLGFSPLPANRLNSFLLLVLRCRFSYRNIRISGRHDTCFENQFKLATFLVLLRC